MELRVFCPIVFITGHTWSLPVMGHLCTQTIVEKAFPLPPTTKRGLDGFHSSVYAKKIL